MLDLQTLGASTLLSVAITSKVILTFDDILVWSLRLSLDFPFQKWQDECRPSYSSPFDLLVHSWWLRYHQPPWATPDSGSSHSAWA